MFIALLASASVMLAATEVSAGAADNGAPAAGKKKDASDKGDKVVCREETIPNSRFTKKVCLLQSAREARAEHHQEDFKEMVDRPVFSIDKGN
jgi:hypothetical protein